MKKENRIIFYALPLSTYLLLLFALVLARGNDVASNKGQCNLKHNPKYLIFF